MKTDHRYTYIRVARSIEKGGTILCEPGVDELQDLSAVLVAILLMAVGVVSVAAVWIGRIAVELDLVLVGTHETRRPRSELGSKLELYRTNPPMVRR